MSNLINNVRISNKAFFKKEEKLSFKNQGLLTGAFSFGAVSLISACSNDSAGGGGGGDEPPVDGGTTYTSSVTLGDSVETLKPLDGTEGVATWTTVSLDTDVYGVTMALTLDSNPVTLNNVAYVGSAAPLTPTPTVTIYDDIDDIDDDANTKDILLYSSAFYQDRPISTPSGAKNSFGGLTIFWDVPTAAGPVDTASLKYLHISGHNGSIFSGLNSAEILAINTGNDLMVTATLATGADNRTTAGAIHIFWDIAEYKSQDAGKVSFSTSEGKDFLSIYGASSSDKIQAPLLVKLKDATKHDLVFSGGGVDNTADDVGGIYILWDVASYDSGRKTIDLAATDGTANYADQGLLTIYGNSSNDLLQLTNGFNPFHHVDDNKNFDLVIHQNSERVDGDHVGAIYILWDVGSYEHETITLGPDSESATYGVFSIIGVAGKGLGGDVADATDLDSHPLLRQTRDDINSSIVKDLNKDGKNDIAFKYDGKTYVIFGEVMAEKNDLNIIKSKTIDLATQGVGDVVDSYFGYDFGDGAVDNVGYVFNRSIDSLDAITPISAPTAQLSETFESHDYWIA